MQIDYICKNKKQKKDEQKYKNTYINTGNKTSKACLIKNNRKGIISPIIPFFVDLYLKKVQKAIE